MAGAKQTQKTTTATTSSTKTVKKCKCTPTFIFDMIAIVALFLCPLFFIIAGAYEATGIQHFATWMLILYYSVICVFLGMAPFNWVLFTRKYIWAFHSPVWRPAIIIFMGFQICPAVAAWANGQWYQIISLIIALVLIILGIIILIIDLIWVGASKCRSLPEGESGTLPTVNSKSTSSTKVVKKATTTTKDANGKATTKTTTTTKG